ncbi:MAG: gamma-glutamyl-gamma-aminobutyrate hydrolase family protein [Alphaproteobacteria bacterium]|nr:gamma-glutamyl-gamma-aminobutyrate hydrolase family protein [Rhodospirillaceae bacterium]MBT6512952.1 gamma-glutamyl-gamma-aminobutyrate hydrolase family protein [Rhodospirillaceae bacterium]MBT7614144.1 gamma-glutamyl-gamma-aminobutyrate hydrolase family protein [Rhodospirillaceae bacterium]MDG2481942.1 gamma-glutamyl-gamma-aminobutyrate hydrolase family protein [Alphaproteobacteria bacterium]
MTDHGALPLVGIPCDLRQIGIHAMHVVGEKYINAVAHGARAMPMLLPCFGRGSDLEPLESLYSIDALLDRIDGVFLTGSPSNVGPHHYGGHQPRETTLLDDQRDALTLPMIRRVVERQIPLLAVCRGIQELNAALGGTLHQHVEEIEGRMDHRENKDDPKEIQYGPAHDVSLTKGGALEQITGLDHFTVNSIHGQGVDQPAQGLQVEAVAPDGHIEALSVRGAETLQLGVQWHPEWRYHERAFDHALFTALGGACRAYRQARSMTAASDAA